MRSTSSGFARQIVLYIWGDNGSSAEGQGGTISELLAQNQISSTIAQHLAALDRVGGLDALGGPKVDNMYHAGWAWAGDTPFHHTKLIASHLGYAQSNGDLVAGAYRTRRDAARPVPPRERRRPDDLRYPRDYAARNRRRLQTGSARRREHGVYIDDADAPTRKRTQYFDNNGSRGIYHDGWYACTFGPLTPWLNSTPGLATWDSDDDRWELYNLRRDFSQSEDLASKEPQRLEDLKTLFLQEARANGVFPIGAGIWLRIHPEDRVKTPYTSWTFDATSTRMPEFAAPGLGRESSVVTIDLECGENASGYYSLGGAAGGVTLYMDDGHLAYEYNMMIIERYTARSQNTIASGKHRIEVTTTIAHPGAPGDVAICVDGAEYARLEVKLTVPAGFSASECLNIGIDLGSPVSLDYFDKRPFAFSGAIECVKVSLQ